MYPQRPDNSKQKAATAIAVIAVIALLTAGVKAFDGRTQSTPTSTNPTSASTTPATTADQTTQSSSGTSNIKDGTYSSSVSYFVPPGEESIKVTLTVKNGVVTDSAIQNSENDRESAAFQQDFTSSYKKYVVGKSLSGLRITHIAGASDTTNGFNQAVSQIQQQAQA